MNKIYICKSVCIIFFISIIVSCSKGYEAGAKKKGSKAVKKQNYWIDLQLNSKKKEKVKGMVYVPPGEFIAGRDVTSTLDNKTREKMASSIKDQHPLQKVFIKGYYIDRFEVTRAQVWGFDSRHEISKKEAELPASNISWKQASLYCEILGKRLPAEWEWEKAARGTDGNIYPWGNLYKEGQVNVGKSFFGKLLPVGSLPLDKSPFGAFDMAGNAAEWTGSWYKAYPKSIYTDPDFGEKFRVVKGFSIHEDVEGEFLSFYTLSSYRFPASPDLQIEKLGFRCALPTKEVIFDKKDDMVKVKTGDKENGKVFFIDKNEVTNNDYGRYNPYKRFINTKGEFPVVNITWFMADRYCRWLGKRLPTKKEWESSALTVDDRFLLKKDKADDLAAISSVRSFSKDKTDSGIFDLIGNAREWVSTWGEQPEGIIENYLPVNGEKVVKGIDFIKNNKMTNEEKSSSDLFQTFVDPSYSFPDIGFRCSTD